MPGMTLCLWFDGRAEEAAGFYVQAFRDGGKPAALGAVIRPGGGPILAVEFRLDGQAFLGLNGGPHYSFTPATSVIVDCADQAQIDHFWTRLSRGGAANRCGWLTDRFGLSWQVVPRALAEMLRGPGSGRVMAALMKMEKPDLAALRAAEA
jgi:predicted 3-demethylubiquinone-9 3-methyltransferase (glyoxalase superfamily)